VGRLRRGFPQARSQRRSTSWGLGPGGSAVSGFTASQQVIVGSGVVPLEEGITVVRIRGNLQAILTSATASPDGFHCAIGIGVVTDQAFAIGATAVPGPLSEMEWNGWMYHRFFDVHADAAFSAGQQPASISFEVDSKAMRKLSIGNTLIAVVETIEDPSAVMSLFFDSRVLAKLS